MLGFLSAINYETIYLRITTTKPVANFDTKRNSTRKLKTKHTLIKNMQMGSGIREVKQSLEMIYCPPKIICNPINNNWNGWELNLWRDQCYLWAPLTIKVAAFISLNMILSIKVDALRGIIALCCIITQYNVNERKRCIFNIFLTFWLFKLWHHY